MSVQAQAAAGGPCLEALTRMYSVLMREIQDGRTLQAVRVHPVAVRGVVGPSSPTHLYASSAAWLGASLSTL